MPLIDESETLLDTSLILSLRENFSYRDGLILDEQGHCWYRWRSDGLEAWWRMFEEIIDAPMGRKLANAACDEEEGLLNSGAGAKAADLLEKAGIITNMNMLPGDTKAMTPSGLRLGVQELTRVGMGTDEMTDVARFYARVLIENEDPASVKNDVREFKSNYQVIRYCFNEENVSGYPM